MVLGASVLIAALGAALLVAIAPAKGATTHKCLGLQATIVGTSAADTLTGTEGDDVIVGLDGDDRISGLSGDDTLCGGKGSDVLHSHDQEAFDKDCAEEAYDNASISGGKGNDRLYGGGYVVKLAGNRGNDLLDGCTRSYYALAVYSGSQVPVKVNLKKGFAKGEGYDTLRNINSVNGSAFNDVLIGSDYTQLIATGSASEYLFGDSGRDKVVGLGGPDHLSGSNGRDQLLGVDGEAGNDELYGGLGADSCLGDSAAGVSDYQESCES